MPPLLTNGALRLANQDPGWAIARIGEQGGTLLALEPQARIRCMGPCPVSVDE